MIGLTTIQARLVGAAVAVLALLALAAALYFAGVSSGKQSVQSKWDADKLLAANVERALLRQHAEKVAALVEKHNSNNLKVSQYHEQELDALRRGHDADRAAVDRAGGLRISAAACRDLATGSEAAGAIVADEGAAATIRLPREIENDLWNQAAACDALSAQVRGLHEWVRINGFYGSESGANPALLDRMIAAPNQTEESNGN